MPSKEIKELRQNGRLEEALAMANDELMAAPENIWAKRNISWVYYGYLKKYAEEIKVEEFISFLNKLKELQLGVEENMIYDNTAWQVGKIIIQLQKQLPIDFSSLNKIFECIKDFHFTKKSNSYSFLYKAFHKGYKNSAKYIEFVDWWGFENFILEDYAKQSLPNGNLVMSIVEQAYIVYAKKLLEGEESNINHYEKILNLDKIKLFLPLLDKIIDNHPDYEYPEYFKAKLILASGNKEDVLSSFLSFAKKKKESFWVWELLADTFNENDDRKMACLCKALSLNNKDEFLVNTRKKLINILVQKQMYEEAKKEMDKVIKTLKTNDWKIANDLTKITAQEWYTSLKVTGNNKQFYIKNKKIAEELLLLDIHEIIIIVDYVNHERQILNFVHDKSVYGFLNYKGFISNPKVGDLFMVRVEKEGDSDYHRIFSSKAIQDEKVEFSGRKVIDGSIKIIPDNNFGFVDDVYIPKYIIDQNKLVDGQCISAKLLLSFNKKKLKWGWKCYHANVI